MAELLLTDGVVTLRTWQKADAPVLVECIKAYATLGEICTTLRGVWGVYQPSQVI